MEPEGSLPHSQVPATCPYSEPHRSNLHPHILHFCISSLIIILPSTPGSSKWSLSLRFSHQNPVYTSPLPIRATCPAHFMLLDFITRTILGEEWRSLSSSLCSFLHSRYLVPLRHKYSPQHPILKHPQPAFCMLHTTAQNYSLTLRTLERRLTSTSYEGNK